MQGMTDKLLHSGIRWIIVWSDPDLIGLKIKVSDGDSLFVNHLYVVHDVLFDVILDLTVGRTHIHGGLLDVRFGEFGPEYANGAFLSRFHVQKLGKIDITCRQQSKVEDFSLILVVNEAKIHLATEPVLLDNFIVDLKALQKGNSGEAYLEGVT